mmetsp:Transcript_49373/g.152256  ORF Transcript_49373/g.152256 Transcript_49373/m.152256 type:complete len:270 (+) Transcript_49373:168-977(+)
MPGDVLFARKFSILPDALQLPVLHEERLPAHLAVDVAQLARALVADQAAVSVADAVLDGCAFRVALTKLKIFIPAAFEVTCLFTTILDGRRRRAWISAARKRRVGCSSRPPLVALSRRLAGTRWRRLLHLHILGTGSCGSPGLPLPRGGTAGQQAFLLPRPEELLDHLLDEFPLSRRRRLRLGEGHRDAREPVIFAEGCHEQAEQAEHFLGGDRALWVLHGAPSPLHAIRDPPLGELLYLLRLVPWSRVRVDETLRPCAADGVVDLRPH